MVWYPEYFVYLCSYPLHTEHGAILLILLLVLCVERFKYSYNLLKLDYNSY